MQKFESPVVLLEKPVVVKQSQNSPMRALAHCCRSLFASQNTPRFFLSSAGAYMSVGTLTNLLGSSLIKSANYDCDTTMSAKEAAIGAAIFTGSLAIALGILKSLGKECSSEETRARINLLTSTCLVSFFSGALGAAIINPKDIFMTGIASSVGTVTLVMAVVIAAEGFNFFFAEAPDATPRVTELV